MTLFDATNARGFDIKQLNVSEKKYVQNATKSMIGRESVARNDKSTNAQIAAETIQATTETARNEKSSSQ